MTRLSPLLLGLAVLALGACSGVDSPVEQIKEQVTGDYPTQTRTYDADQRATYAAARQALKAMRYRFLHGGPAEGYLDAVSPIGPGDDPGTLRQFVIHASFAPSLDGKSTDVTVRMAESDAPENSGQLQQGSEVPLRDTPLYQVFFRGIQDALAQPDTRGSAVGAPVGR